MRLLCGGTKQPQYCCKTAARRQCAVRRTPVLTSDKTVDGRLITSLSPCSERRVSVKCDTCGVINTTSYANYNRAQKTTHNGSGRTTCRKCAVTKSALARKGKPRAPKPKLPPEQLGANHKSWRGGRYIDANNYVMVHQPDRSKARTTGWAHYRKEHIVVMEQHIGRRLLPNETVHHIDGNKQNNVLSNLYLVHSHAEHRNAHTSLQQIGYALIRTGMLTFDLQNGQYIVGEALQHLLDLAKTTEGNT